MPKIITALLDQTDRIDISKIYKTEPQKLDSENYFLNAVVRIESELDHATLKQHFNRIEGQLGRDRSDPDKKTKDRTADIDILFCLAIQDQQVKDSYLPEEVYVRRPLVELLQHLNYEIGETKEYPEQTGVALSIGRHSIGETVTSIHQDAFAGTSQL
jgi:2-amino-4-hydroxy-6-hydroxymethyldihydropteridine diphosphokinase